MMPLKNYERNNSPVYQVRALLYSFKQGNARTS